MCTILLIIDRLLTSGEKLLLEEDKPLYVATLILSLINKKVSALIMDYIERVVNQDMPICELIKIKSYSDGNGNNGNDG